MNLSQFPFVATACWEILRDEGPWGDECSPLNGAAEIPERWEERVQLAELVLLRCWSEPISTLQNMELSDQFREDLREYGYKTVFDVIVAGGDWDQIAMELLQYPTEAIGAVMEVLGEFFAGELREVFVQKGEE